jgi:hypothetical protein
MDMLNTTYKKCDCPLDYWEVIVVEHEKLFGDRSVIFHHCDKCQLDFAITDFFSGRILFELELNYKK